MTKDFDHWNKVKKEVQKLEKQRLFKERDIWWCSIGVNVGHETDGKSKEYNRPVLIVKKFNQRLFWGVPLSSKLKNNKHYKEFEFLGKAQSAMLTQMRLMDAKRLNERMGRLARTPFLEIKTHLKNYFEE